MRKAATSRGTTGLVLEGVRVARVALVKAVRRSSRAVSGTSASKRKTRRGGRVGGVLGAAHGAGARCPAPVHTLRRAVVLLVPTRYMVVQVLGDVLLGRCMVLL